jgi:catalase-peroxidase
MNDEETVALVAGGHTFGKGHGAGPDSNVGKEPEGAAIEEMGLGWMSSFASGKGSDTITSGFEGAWTANPIKWDNGYFDLLFGYEWEKVETPAGAIVWHAIDVKDEDLAPDAEDSSVKVPTMMTTADISLREDPIYKKISKRFHENPEEFADAFARAWFKLLHRDMGPKTRYMGPEVPQEELIWQDPVPEGATNYDIDAVKAQLLSSELTIQEMVETAWASASTYRGSDMRGGANGSRIRLSPQKDWEINKPESLQNVLDIYEKISSDTGASVADVIVLAGNVGIEKASGVNVPFTPGRGDASQEQTDIDSFAALEPVSDAFRNFHKSGIDIAAEEIMLDKAQLLGLTAPEMTVLLGGMRSLGISASGHGLFTSNSDELSNDYFNTLLDMSVAWKPNGTGNSFEALDRSSGEKVRTATRADLVFGSNSQLRAICEVYASSDANEKFTSDFISAWNKVMENDLF